MERAQQMDRRGPLSCLREQARELGGLGVNRERWQVPQVLTSQIRRRAGQICLSSLLLALESSPKLQHKARAFPSSPQSPRLLEPARKGGVPCSLSTGVLGLAPILIKHPGVGWGGPVVQEAPAPGSLRRLAQPGAPPAPPQLLPPVSWKNRALSCWPSLAGRLQF